MINAAQRQLLAQVAEGPKRARDIATMLANATGGTYSYDRVHSALRRLEDRNLVRRLPGVYGAKWELTEQGRNELEG